MNFSTPSPHRFTLPGQKPSKRPHPPPPRTPLSVPALSQLQSQIKGAKPFQQFTPSHARFARTPKFSLRKKDAIPASDLERRERRDPMDAINTRALQTDPIDIREFDSGDQRGHRRRLKRVESIEESWSPPPATDGRAEHGQATDSDEMLLDSEAHDSNIRFNDSSTIQSSSTKPCHRIDPFTPCKRQRLTSPLSAARNFHASSPPPTPAPPPPRRGLPNKPRNTLAITTPAATKPRFILHPSERTPTTSNSTRPRTAAGPKAFIRPPADSPQQAQPSAETFSPRKRGYRFVEGGMAATVAGWIVEGWEKEQTASARQSQAVWRGWKPAAAVGNRGVREKVVTVRVGEIQRGTARPGLGGLSLMKGIVGEEVKWVGVVTGLGLGKGSRCATEGDVVRLEGSKWDIGIDGVRWLMAVEGSVVSREPG
ncbi:hypothetical protein P152DRAFT_477328 [Eremomyces bilateralis CBS 781.70]|uniref:Uncharacterized protein n=1 Tax=Eremomyces bilateralis CBS 781.70 TaxID=1392243 RepID=A0A6G1FRE6_9PEZI|nr:uncharacterized protein P152DRAFT_477328 [Eremomyces bilateralis CBS 781.70]KAF1808415.1 hypothetical protein P152DRAFT_477328 [Eremomyces bilateralis CBS 781.70]